MIDSANPVHLRWQWRGGPFGGNIFIGDRMNSPSSHKAGDDFWFDIHVICYRAKRDAMGRFLVSGPLDNGAGMIRHKVENDFMAGGILWSMVRYGG